MLLYSFGQTCRGLMIAIMHCSHIDKNSSSMLQFAVGFVIYTKAPWREIKTKKWAAGPHKSKTTQRSKCQVHKSASSDGNTYKSNHKLRGGGGKNNPS